MQEAGPQRLPDQASPEDMQIPSPVQGDLWSTVTCQELVRNTPEDHADYHRLMAAKEKVADGVMYVNEGQRRIEAQARMVAIQNSIDGYSVRACRWRR